MVLLVLNNNEILSKEDEDLLEKIKNYKSIIVVNKIDLDKKLDYNKIKGKNVVYINTLTYDGIKPLIDKIKELFNLEQLDNSDLTYLSNSRQISLAKEAQNIIKDIEKGLDNNVPIDMLEIDIKRIWEKLGEIIGETYQEELIDKLFSQFCLGK